MYKAIKVEIMPWSNVRNKDDVFFVVKILLQCSLILDLVGDPPHCQLTEAL